MNTTKSCSRLNQTYIAIRLISMQIHGNTKCTVKENKKIMLYNIQVGPPCPEGMELIPAKSKDGKELYAECRCPPEYALSNTDGKCYKLFTIGPCLPGSFFGPETVYKNNVTT